jgi:hypothetical protein
VRVNVDERALTDPRIKRLAMRLGWSPFEALGRLVHVWAYLYDREGGALHPEEVDASADREGMASTMVLVGLAQETPDGLLVAGRERAAWVADRRAAAVTGGKARAEGAQRDNGKFRKPATKSQRDAGDGASVAPAKRQPNTSPPAPAPAPAPEDLHYPSGSGVEAPPAPLKLALQEPSPGGPSPFQRVRDAVLELYREATGGHEHPWGRKEQGQVAELLKMAKGDPEAVLLRAARLWRDTPAWMARGGTPPSLGTLVAKYADLAPLVGGARTDSLRYRDVGDFSNTPAGPVDLDAAFGPAPGKKAGGS